MIWRHLLRPINVVVTPIPFPKPDITIPSIITGMLSKAAPEERKIKTRPHVKDVYPATVIQKYFPVHLITNPLNREPDTPAMILGRRRKPATVAETSSTAWKNSGI